MQYKKPSQRKVVLNVYGGESLFHPDIVEILEACKEKYKQYQDQWILTVTCTTNGIVGKNLWQKIVPLIDEFTVSYHTENLPKQKQQYLENILYLKEQNKRFKSVIMMHTNAELFKDAETVIEFCKQHEIRYVPKPFDVPAGVYDPYTQDQFNKLKTFWIKQVPVIRQDDYTKSLAAVGQGDKVQSIDEGRPCCGGRKLSLNGDLKSNVSFVPRQGFEGWSCSVNWFFLYVRQYDKNIYTNKDCKMSTTGNMEPLGTLDNADQILDTLQTQLDSKTMPIIKCKKQSCFCGICAPKAESQTDFMDLIKRNVPIDVFQKEC
jgi:hypothetical protein